MAAAIVRQLRNPWSAKTDMSRTVRPYTSYASVKSLSNLP
jgi:hypothetical protein